jgi:hypothetical protein
MHIEGEMREEAHAYAQEEVSDTGGTYYPFTEALPFLPTSRQKALKPWLRDWLLSLTT